MFMLEEYNTIKMKHPQILVKDGPSEEHVREDIAPSNTGNYPSFSNIGGLDDHIQALREMIIIPLLYPEIFTKYKINPVRGVLFHGPPGTGKTLVAGALAKECSKLKGQKVSFFHRKAADVLVKWVGESEQKLRDIFAKANSLRPSIIFFDELDGLVPERSCNQDHIHSSIVTTLLALMDGLDKCQGVIVIGATNRLSAIDPALRRSGRFDRELYFPLPNKEARKQILEVHTKTWGKHQAPNIEFLTYLASVTEGYCGSDIQALCTEAVMSCLRRTYPDIKKTDSKLNINMRNVKVHELDFITARKKTTPSSHYFSNSTKLSKVIQPLLQRQLNGVMKIVNERWPHFKTPGLSKEDVPEDVGVSGRVLLTGTALQGQSTHMAPALLQALEHLPVHTIDIQTLYKDSSMFTEEICIQKIEEAKNHLPAIIMIYRIDQLVKLMPNNTKEVFQMVLKDIPLRLPILVIASTSTDELSPELHEYFHEYNSVTVKMDDPTTEEKYLFLNPLLTRAVLNIPKKKINDTPINAETVKLGKRKHSSNCSDEQIKKTHFENGQENEIKEYRAIGSLASVTGNRDSSNVDQFQENHLTKVQPVRKKGLRGELLEKNRIYNICRDYQNFMDTKEQQHAFTSFEECQYFKDSHDSNDYVSHIKYLFKRAIFKTSKNMQISQLELFYDVLQNRIIQNRNNPKKLTDELEEMLTCFEKMP